MQRPSCIKKGPATSILLPHYFLVGTKYFILAGRDMCTHVLSFLGPKSGSMLDLEKVACPSMAATYVRYLCHVPFDFCSVFSARDNSDRTCTDSRRKDRNGDELACKCLKCCPSFSFTIVAVCQVSKSCYRFLISLTVAQYL